MSAVANALCPASTYELIGVEVNSCQAMTLHSDDKNVELSGDKQILPEPVNGTLVTGLIVNLRQVLSIPPPHPTFNGYCLPPRNNFTLQERTSFFVEESVFEVCAAAKATKFEWFVNAGCCDTLPLRGLCLVPGLIPTMKKARPTKWHEYEPPDCIEQ